VIATEKASPTFSVRPGFVLPQNAKVTGSTGVWSDAIRSNDDMKCDDAVAPAIDLLTFATRFSERVRCVPQFAADALNNRRLSDRRKLFSPFLKNFSATSPGRCRRVFVRG